MLENPEFTPIRPRKTLRRTFTQALGVLLALAALTACVVAWLYWRAKSSLPQVDGTIKVSGLRASAQVLRDARGVPHIRAQSLEDVLFAQGYVTAQDRLWQMDINRRLAEGELSEILGDRTLSLDIENRTLGLGVVCERTVAELDAESRKLLSDYARGVNAFINAHLDRLPIEFTLLRYKPRPWREADSLAVALNMAKYLSNSWPDKLMREHIRRKLSPELYQDIFPDHSPLDHPVAEVPRESESRKQKAESRSKKTEVESREPEDRSQKLEAGDQNFPQLDSISSIPYSLLPTSHSPHSLGSNNWVISGAHTQSGAPLLANDPHLSHSVPSVWYMTHLKSPQLNLTGVTFPGLPLIIIGHNEHIAWGMTNAAPDVQDLFIESFSSRNPRKYFYMGEWIDADERRETIKVRGRKDYSFTVYTTRHGPVISHEGDRDLSLAWTALLPHALRYPFLQVDQAGDWQEFTNALRGFTGPTENFVYADAKGNIGYYAAGWIPIRRTGDGAVPVPGSTEDYEWTGFIPFEALPHAFNPPGGLIATANGRVVPDGYPYFLTHKWEAPYRTARLYQLLEGRDGLTPGDMLRVQSDITSIQDKWLAKELVKASVSCPPATEHARYALDQLRHWDGRAVHDSLATLVCEATWQTLLERILKPKLGPDLSDYHWPMRTAFLENAVSNHWGRWLPPGDKDYNATLIRSLEESVKRIAESWGSQNYSEWQWGKTIPLTFRHPLASSIPLFGRLLNSGPFLQNGTPTTVKQTTMTIGPSMRMVIDFAHFDDSGQNLTLGESGQVFSPHYRDQLRAWLDGRSFPMLFSDSAVDHGAVNKLVLEPY